MAFTSGPVKRTGHYHDLYKQSATRSEHIGTKWQMDTGEVYRYAYARAALTAGQMTQMTALSTYMTNIANATAYAVGTKTIAVTISAIPYAIPEDGLRGGKLIINDETGEGHSYPIVGNTAVAASGTSVTLVLGRGLIHAFTTSEPEITIVPSPWGGWGIEPTSITAARTFPTGVPLIDVTAGYYCWVQTGGICSVLHDSSVPTVGILACTSIEDAGAIGYKLQGAATHVTGAAVVGVGLLTGIDGEYNPIYLTIDR